MQETVSDLQDSLDEVSDILDTIDSSDFSNQEKELTSLISEMTKINSLERELYEEVFDSESAKERIATFLQMNKHQPVKTETISRIAGIKDYTRRIRELRNEEGFIIATSRTNAELARDEYVLVEVRDVDDKRRLDSKTRDEYLEQHPCCEQCGFDPRQHNPDDVSGNRYLEVDHIEAYENFDTAAEANDESNLQTLCNVCHNGKGASNRRWV